MLLNFKKKIGISNQFDDFKLAMEILPSAVMVCEVNNFTIVYANPKSIELLETIKHEITIDPAQIVGSSIDVFHKNVNHQRKMLLI